VTIADAPTIAVIDDGPSEAVLRSKIEWGPVIGGAIAAAALASVLHGFAAAIGLSVSSTAPTWRDASFALILLSGLYLLLAALASYAFGAYIAARLRTRIALGPRAASSESDITFGDGMHGLLVWGLATLLTAFIALAVAQMTPRLAAPSGAGAGPSTSVAGENIIAFDLDRLFRGERRPAGDMNMVRAEAARILMTTSSHRGMLAEDRAYLVRLVSANTGLAAADADKRVTEVAASAKDNIARARRASAILAFMVAAAALVGAATAWFAACAGGRHREGLEAVPDLWSWDRPYGRA
jgi:hypothetical protein